MGQGKNHFVPYFNLDYYLNQSLNVIRLKMTYLYVKINNGGILCQNIIGIN